MISFNESASALPAVRSGPVVSGFAGAGAGADVVWPGFAGVLPDAALSVFGWALAGAPVEVRVWAWVGAWVPFWPGGWVEVFAVAGLEGSLVATGVVGAGGAGGSVVSRLAAEADADGEETAAAAFAGAAPAVSVTDPPFCGPHALSAAPMTPAARTAVIICLGRTDCMKQAPWVLLAAWSDYAPYHHARHPDQPTPLAPTSQETAGLGGDNTY
ncbi:MULTISPECIES: hypothetical protein [unclassified Kitasatospora]|uniref:hypothetical protein n=1 Tax=unclassified Kitasatospora TaxID=2633591 RepID=UPI0034108F2F